MKLSTQRILLVFVVAWTVGCAATRGEGPTQGRSVSSFEQQMNTVYFLGQDQANEDDYSRVAVERTGASRTATGNLKCWAVLRNRTDYQQDLEYQVHFYDETQAPVEQQRSWTWVSLNPEEVKSIEAFSTRQGASCYVIQVKGAR